VEGNGVGNLNLAADCGDLDRISDLINLGRKTNRHGDAHGFADRTARTKQIMEVLA
jgi:predicted chitinase